ASPLVSLAHQPTLEYSRLTVKPGVPAGTMIEEISGRLPARPVMARTVTTDVIEVPELVMNAFDPSITHSRPAWPAAGSRRAVVRIPPGMSDPPPGSVSPNAASRSPRHSGGSHSSRCAAEPKR